MVYVLDDTGKVYSIYGKKNTVTASITVADGLEAICVNPSTNLVYAAVGDNKVCVIEGKKNTVTATITVGSTTSTTGAICVNPSTNMVYAAVGDINTKQYNGYMCKPICYW